MNKLKDVEYQINNDGIAEVYVHALSTWDGFDEIIDYLLKNYNVEIISNEKKYYNRDAVLNINGYQLLFSNDDLFGNVFTGVDASSGPFLKKLSKDIAAKLR